MPPTEQRIQELEDWKAQTELNQLRYPLDSVSRSIISTTIDKFFTEKVIKALWEDFYYYNTFFESTDGYSDDEGALPFISGSGVLIATGAVSGNRADFYKIPEINNILRWDREQRFRASMRLGFVTSMEARIGVGSLRATIGTHFGFYILNGALYGESAYVNSTNQTQINLNVSIADTTARTDLEASFIPKIGITFKVNGIERGSIRTNLPDQDPTLTHDSFFQAFVKTNTAAVRELYFSNFEFLQKRTQQQLS